VYELVDEIGGDKFVAYRETSEYADELDVVVYRSEKETPPEILELMNQGDLPEEVKAANRHKQSLSRQAAESRDNKKRLEMEKKTMENMQQGVDKEARNLNGKKRDRRTIEEIQSDMLMGEAKKVKREE